MSPVSARTMRQCKSFHIEVYIYIYICRSVSPVSTARYIISISYLFICVRLFYAQGGKKMKCDNIQAYIFIISINNPNDIYIYILSIVLFKQS